MMVGDKSWHNILETGFISTPSSHNCEMIKKYFPYAAIIGRKEKMNVVYR